MSGLAYEPVPRNVQRLRGNLAAFEDRYTLSEAAAAACGGPLTFGVEDSGRYGGSGWTLGVTIEVSGAGINEIMGEVLEGVPAIDVLKIDTEGSELDLLGALEPELLRRVRTAYLEVERRPAHPPDSFDSEFHNETWVLRGEQHGPSRVVGV